MDASSLIQTIAVYALPVVFAITLHEAAHGYVARLLGDNTAYMMGRVSFNPMRHIDPFGTIVIPLVLYFLTSGAFLFGYARPVPVTFRNLRNPRWGSLWVALAGPGCNFVQALIWGFVSIGLAALAVDEPFFTRMAGAGVGVNLVLAVLNLFRCRRSTAGACSRRCCRRSNRSRYLGSSRTASSSCSRSSRRAC